MIQPEMGYGEDGDADAKVPANAVLKATIELVDFQVLADRFSPVCDTPESC